MFQLNLEEKVENLLLNDSVKFIHLLPFLLKVTYLLFFFSFFLKILPCTFLLKAFELHKQLYNASSTHLRHRSTILPDNKTNTIPYSIDSISKACN